MTSYGKFGNLANEYKKFRRGYPEKVFEYINTFLKQDVSLKILDIGCGTGISTRQIKENFGSEQEVIGSDIDLKMIKSAEEYFDGIRYDVCPADSMPYESREFDLVTAFGAFHWFTNDQAISEIKRVLKPTGLFVVVNKSDIGNFKKDMIEAVNKFSIELVKSVKDDYDPAAVLNNNGFNILDKRSFEITEYFTAEEAIGMYKSMSLYNLVPLESQEKFLEELRSQVEERLDKGLHNRELSIDVVISSDNGQ